MKGCGLLLSFVVAAEGASSSTSTRTTCGNLKEAYKQETCCGAPTKEVGFQIVPDPDSGVKLEANPCDGKKPKAGSGFDNLNCFSADDVVAAIEQSGGDVTKGYEGGFNATPRVPITTPYWKSNPPLCPVNVHWHLGAEHRSDGQYDEKGKGPMKAGTPSNFTDPARRLADVRYGYACHHYDASDAKFTTEYKWRHCIDMKVGETYEVHWPHSAIGACNTPHQFQSPFYDGVFCGWTDAVAKAVNDDAQNLVNHVGVQGQVFVIVNDEKFYYPDLMRGAIVDGEFWKDVAAYTGSTTGTTRDNKKCSTYTPITWQVDRKCHMISASSFDKMCADMKQQPDDMSSDLHAHGARVLVTKPLVADNLRDYER